MAALRAILVERPGLVRVRLELARAFFLKGDDGLAREHFERVLAGGPPPAVAANVRRFLGTMRARRRWSAWFGFEVAPDTNVNASSDAGTVWLFGLPFRRDEASRARLGFGAVFRGGGEYQHPLSDRVRLRAGGAAARREYAGKEFDRTAASVHFGPRVLVGDDTGFSLLATAGRQWRAGRPYSRDLGLRFEAEHRVSRQLTMRGHGGVAPGAHTAATRRWTVRCSMRRSPAPGSPGRRSAPMPRPATCGSVRSRSAGAIAALG